MPATAVTAPPQRSVVELDAAIMDAERDHRVAIGERTQHGTREGDALRGSLAVAATHDDAATLADRKVRQAAAKVDGLKAERAEANKRETAAKCAKRSEDARGYREAIEKHKADRALYVEAIAEIDAAILGAEYEAAQHEAFVRDHQPAEGA
jgi:hypothetical protein